MVHAKQLADVLADAGGTGAVGAKGPASLFGYLDKPMAGTAAADYVSYIDTLKSQLTLPKMEFFKGLGAMSDREFKTLGDSITALNRNMSESTFKKELASVKTTLGAVRARLGGATTPTNDVVGSPGSRVPVNTGAVQMVAPDGRPLTVPADQVDEAMRRGAKVVP